MRVLFSADWRTKVRSCINKKFSAKVILAEGMNKQHLSFVRVSYHMIYHLVICLLRFFGSKKQEILRSMQTTKMHTFVNISVKFLLMSVYKILVLTVPK